MRKLSLTLLCLVLSNAFIQVAGAQTPATTATTSEIKPASANIGAPGRFEAVGGITVVYSNVSTHQFNFTVTPNPSASGYMFSGLSDSWMLNLVDPKKLSPEQKFITVKVVNNVATPTAVGTKAELEAIGKAVLETVRSRGFDVTSAKIITSQTNDKVIDLERHPTANVVVSISSRAVE